MSERWKYQIKTGSFWGVFMTAFSVLFELQEKPLKMQLSNPSLYYKAVVFIVIGIFVLGYFNWKSRMKSQS